LQRARCAQDQGKFWDYHDTPFIESPKLGPDDLKRYAAQVGLDVTKFEACLTQGIHKVGLQRDVDEGNRLGITGTPALFINGRPLQTLSRPSREWLMTELMRVAAAQSGFR